MKIIGLTGNIGSGKSTVARMFAEAGIPVIDADQLARDVVLPGTEALREIEVRFPGVVNEKGELDRAALAKRVFADPAERVALEQITHPRIALEARRMLQALEDKGHPIAIYEAALIVEKNLQAAQDGLIVVSVSPEEQLRRVLARDKTSEAEVRARIAAQLPQEQKIAAATLVIDNSGPREALGPQIDRVLKALGAPLKSAKIELQPLGARSEPRPLSYLVTGFPKLIARRMALAFLAHAKTSSVTLLCRPRHLSEGRAFVESLPPDDRVRTRVVDGDIAHLHLGLSTPEYRALTESITDLFHAAEWSDLTAERHELARVNVEGTRALLELADDCRYLRRFTHVSTVFVAGDRTGVIAEDELSSGQHFRNGYEETRYEAELLVRRAMTELPCTIVRPSIVVGDSRTGEIDRFGGPYTVGIMLTSGPVPVPLPLPHDGVAPLNVVPIDYVVAAAAHLHHDERAIGRTFHLVDPNPASVRRIYDLVAQRMGRKLPKLSLGYRLTDALLKLPGLERLTREQRMAIATVNHLCFFSSRGTMEVLEGTGIRCPPIESYLDALIEFVKSEYRRKKEG